MTLTLLDIYNNVTGQSWSVFDTGVESQEEFDSGVLTSIQKALNVLWHSYNFSFRLKFCSTTSIYCISNLIGRILVI